jgi:hypothetical protein
MTETNNRKPRRHIEDVATGPLTDYTDAELEAFEAMEVQTADEDHGSRLKLIQKEIAQRKAAREGQA